MMAKEAKLSVAKYAKPKKTDVRRSGEAFPRPYTVGVMNQFTKPQKTSSTKIR